MAERAIAREMRPNRHPLDHDSATRILQGLVHPDDAPPGYGEVAGLLASASALPAVDEDAAASTIAAMVEAIREGASTPQTSRRKSMVRKLLAGKALAVIGVVALSASGAAAATGSLPDPAQGAVAGAASHVGIHIPQPGDRGNSAGHRQDGAHRPDGTTSTTAGGDDSSGDNNANHGQTVSGTAHQAQEGSGKVGPTVCAVASAGKCQAGDDHKGQGGGDDHGTTPTTAGSGDDHGGQGEAGDDPSGHDANDDHGGGNDDTVTPPTTPTTGSAATGDDHSGGSGSSGHGDSGSSGRH